MLCLGEFNTKQNRFQVYRWAKKKKNPEYINSLCTWLQETNECQKKQIISIRFFKNKTINDCNLNGLCPQYSQLFTSIPTPLEIHFLVYRQKKTIHWSSVEQFLLSRLTLGHLCVTSHGWKSLAHMSHGWTNLAHKSLCWNPRRWKFAPACTQYRK